MLKELLRKVEVSTIKTALEAHNTLSKASKHLGISRRTLKRRIDTYPELKEYKRDIYKPWLLETLSEDEIKEIVQDFNDYNTLRELKEIHGYSESAISRILQETMGFKAYNAQMLENKEIRSDRYHGEVYKNYCGKKCSDNNELGDYE